MTNNQEWNETLFGCCDDCETCFCGWCCPSCLFGQNAEKSDGSNCCLMCCAHVMLTPCYLCWIPHYMKREALRQKYDLPEDPNCSDCPAACCCGPCALCQEARFLKRAPKQSSIAVTDGRPVMAQPYGYH